MEVIDTSKAKINDWCRWDRLTFHSIENTAVFVKSSIEDIKKIQVHKSDIKDNSCLYFGKTSKFPRHKLKETSLKRCIKVEKSDIQVIGKLDFSYLYDMKVVMFSTKNDTFIINLRSLSTHWNQSETLDLKSDDYIDRIKEKNRILENATVIYVGEVTILPKPIFEDLANIENNIFNNVVTDTELDIFINNNAESLTIDTCDLLFDLLNSKDYQSMELGLKMLVGFNVNECPNTVKLLLSNSHLPELKAWNSVGVNQVKNSIKIQHYFNFLTEYNKIENDLDKELSRHIWKKMSLKQINKFADKFNLPDLVFKVYAE